VIGFGEKKTPKPFVSACDRFVYTEILRKYTEAPRKEDSQAAVSRRKTALQLKRDAKLVNLLREAVEDSADDSGWAYLGNVGQYVANRSPEFDSRNYGYAKLGNLVRAIGLFETDERASDTSPAKLIYVRDKRRKAGSR
jgi:hypothetical protein